MRSQHQLQFQVSGAYMTVQSQDLEHGGKPPERQPEEQKGTRQEKPKESDKGSGAPKDKGGGTYSGNNTPSRTD